MNSWGISATACDVYCTFTMCIPTVCFLSLSIATFTAPRQPHWRNWWLAPEPILIEALLLVNCRTMCAWYVIFKGEQPGIYTSWAECSKHVLGYHGAMHKKYSSYEEGMAAFNSTINSISTSNPASTPTVISCKTVVIFFLCALLCAMRIKLKKCNGCNF